MRVPLVLDQPPRDMATGGAAAVSESTLALIRDSERLLTPPLERAVTVFQRWLFLPDERPLLAVLGTVAANLLDGDPVWLVLVGPPGGGKSELLQAVAGLEKVHPTATLTEPALLSGTSKREQQADAKGGLLRAIGDFGIILCKDFGSVLSMHRDGRNQVLAALREIYDGSWTRHVGVDGGRTLSWEGKVGLLAGCTPTIDRHHAVMGTMGERLVLFRLPEVEAEELARRALEHASDEQKMREQFAGVVAALFTQDLGTPRTRTNDESGRLVSLSTLVVRARSAVERDGYTREIELIPDAEAPTRLVKVLDRLLAGLDAIGAERERAWSVVTKAALDSIPALRRSVMDVLLADRVELDTSKIAEHVAHPKRTTERALEDLAGHGLIRRHAHGQGKATTWTMTSWAAEHYAAATFPETSDRSIYKPETASYDISGEVPQESEDPGNGEVAPDELGWK